MTSNPASRAATAICSAPLECPSSPGLATRRRGGPPVRAASARVRATRGPSSSPRCPTPPLTPVGARNSPKTWRSAPAHFPVVPPAWARAMVASMMLAAGPPALHVGDLLGLDPVVDLQDVLDLTIAGERGGGGLGEAVHAHHALLACLNAPHPLGLAAHQARLELVDGREGAPEPLD